jgi:hypothetical protein
MTFHVVIIVVVVKIREKRTSKKKERTRKVEKKKDDDSITCRVNVGSGRFFFFLYQTTPLQYINSFSCRHTLRLHVAKKKRIAKTLRRKL